MDGKFSGGGLFLFDSVDERGSLNDFGEEFGSVEGSPFLLGGLHELEDHREAGRSAAAPFGPFGS